MLFVLSLANVYINYTVHSLTHSLSGKSCRLNYCQSDFS